MPRHPAGLAALREAVASGLVAAEPDL